MIDLRRATVTLAATALFLVGCGGGAGTTADPSAGEASIGPSAATTSIAPATSGPSEAGGAAAGVCELVTTDELATLLGVPSVKVTVFRGPPDSCSVEDDSGIPMAAWSYSTSNSQAVYDALVLPGQSVVVPGLGDRAAFVDNTGLLVLKGDAMLVVGVMNGSGDLSEDEQMELQKKIADLALRRM